MLPANDSPSPNNCNALFLHVVPVAKASSSSGVSPWAADAPFPISRVPQAGLPCGNRTYLVTFEPARKWPGSGRKQRASGLFTSRHDSWSASARRPHVSSHLFRRQQLGAPMMAAGKMRGSLAIFGLTLLGLVQVPSCPILEHTCISLVLSFISIASCADQRGWQGSRFACTSFRGGYGQPVHLCI